jgi:predicted NAD/FAD-binding protein
LKPISIFVETKDKTKKIMKVTIELSEAEAKGLKEYLKDLDGIRASKSDIQQHIQGIVNAVLNAPQEAVSEYIAKYN